VIIPLPTIIMTWVYPEWVRSWNTVWLAGALALWFIGYPLIMRGRWRVQVLRLQAVYGFAHLFNILHLIDQRVAAWHPTGSKAPAPIAIKVKRFYTAYLGLALTLGAVGLILRIAQDGPRLFVGMLIFFTLNIYVAGPLVILGINDLLRYRRRVAVTEAADEVTTSVRIPAAM
jgi:cellulose synthase (UDP-forming)